MQREGPRSVLLAHLPIERLVGVVETEWFARIDSSVGDRQATQTSPRHHRTRQAGSLHGPCLLHGYAPSSQQSALGRVTWGASDRRHHWGVNFLVLMRVGEASHVHVVRRELFIPIYMYLCIVSINLLFPPCSAQNKTSVPEGIGNVSRSETIGEFSG